MRQLNTQKDLLKWNIKGRVWSSLNNLSVMTTAVQQMEVWVMRETRRERTAPQTAAGISQRKMMCFCLIGLAIVIETDEAVDVTASI